MDVHRFKIGQAVEFYPPRGMYAPRGLYLITGELPVRAGEFEYRIKHSHEDYERVAAESDLNEFLRRPADDRMARPSSGEANRAAVQARKRPCQALWERRHVGKGCRSRPMSVRPGETADEH